MRGGRRLLGGLLGGAVLALTGCGVEPAGPDRPNVVLISIDSLRPDHLGCYGYERPTSPTIDRLAAQGVRFETAVSTTSWTLPAHAALFTGLFDSAHGLVDNGLRLGADQNTLAEVFEAADYQTAGFYGGPYLHPTYGVDQGFAHYESCMGGVPDDASGDRLRAEAQSSISASHDDVTGPRTVERVSAWLQDLDARPFFLFLHLWDVHYDYIPPPRYVEMFAGDYTGDLDPRRFTKNEAIHADMPQEDLDYLISLYDGEIRFTDDNLARILEALEAAGRMQDTLVIVTADHGEEFFEHGRKGHQNNLFDETLKVPLIFHWPGRLPAGKVITRQARLIDVGATACGLAGLTPPGGGQGRDLGPLFRDEELAPAGALLELLVGEKHFRALRTERHKFMAFEKAQPQPRAAFFDLRRDPLEKNNLSPETPGFRKTVAEYTQLLQQSLRRHQEIGPGALEFWTLNPHMKAQLEALGYLDEAPEDGEE